MSASWLWAAHVSATGYMVGVIWFVQLIQYPWFHDVPPDKFRAYHERYTRTMGWVVGPAMMVELITGAMLVMQPGGVNPTMLLISLGLLAIVWLSTLCLQIPCHHRLSQGYDGSIHRKLVQTNWIRTAGWSVRLVLLLFHGL
jgi:hypothetical protein